MTSPWQQIYHAGNALEAHLVKGMLEHAGIDVRLTGENLSAAAGELPADVVQVALWVQEKDVSRASQLVMGYEQGGFTPWRCPACGELNEGQFDWCWQCSTDKPESA
ncbi:DUF2007 domain-containing protein [Photobacterium sp. GJ3]|uniref:putative signal transducing protein n=1 Tax=Photobacterium sp. GJ3 TaxID=2829502 RepID=UPI001B8D389C|nr:DUF2007 domain-containing protein [Photobacterium sp. GJ3]QUJ67354.1 DUF2007 domain-containing protein [Photobacterium sp. GJ3]